MMSARLAFTPRTEVHTAKIYRSRGFFSAPSGQLYCTLYPSQSGKRISRHARIVAQAGGQSDLSAGKYPSWDSIHTQLTAKYGLQSVSVSQAAAMIDAGEAVLADVRLEETFEESHPRGAINAPAFRIINLNQGGGIGRAMKLLLMRANGVTPTEPHPEFVSRAVDAAGPKKKVILACEAGGSTASTPNFPKGKASRSLKAAWRLLYTESLPVDRVLHLDGGVIAWFQAGQPMNGEYDESRAYSTPNAVKS